MLTGFGVPRVAAIHDLSGFGRCSLTAIIPVLSAMGVQVCPVPTAILSTHSGGFGPFSFTDLTDSLEGYIDHWRSLGLRFDCIYSGFLGSAAQMDIVARFISDFRSENCMVFVDPVMADHGKLYATYTPEMQQEMGQLAREADVLTPNLTEACFLLGIPYSDAPVDARQMKRLLKGLSGLGPDIVVVKSVKTADGRFANIGYSRTEDSYWKVEFERVPASYPGTGDIFASVMIGRLLSGGDLPQAIDVATQFLSVVVRATYNTGTPEREGVVLEKVLGSLLSDYTCSTYQVIS